MDVVYPSLIWKVRHIQWAHRYMSIKGSTTEVGSSWKRMSEAKFIFWFISTHQVLIILVVVDTRVLGYVALADSSQERHFASMADYKYKKAISIYSLEVIGYKAAQWR